MPKRNLKAASPTKATSPTDDKQYLEFLSSLKLVGMGLKGCSAVVDREVLWGLANKRKPESDFSEQYKPTEIGDGFFEAEGRYNVKIADGERLALKIECTFEVHIHAKDAVTPAMANRFAEADLRFVLLPYARYFVSNMTSQMEIAPIVLPLATAMGGARTKSNREKPD